MRWQGAERQDIAGRESQGKGRAKERQESAIDQRTNETAGKVI